MMTRARGFARAHRQIDVGHGLAAPRGSETATSTHACGARVSSRVKETRYCSAHRGRRTAHGWGRRQHPATARGRSHPRHGRGRGAKTEVPPSGTRRRDEGWRRTAAALRAPPRGGARGRHGAVSRPARGTAGGRAARAAVPGRKNSLMSLSNSSPGAVARRDGSGPASRAAPRTVSAIAITVAERHADAPTATTARSRHPATAAAPLGRAAGAACRGASRGNVRARRCTRSTAHCVGVPTSRQWSPTDVITSGTRPRLREAQHRGF